MRNNKKYRICHKKVDALFITIRFPHLDNISTPSAENVIDFAEIFSK